MLNFFHLMSIYNTRKFIMSETEGPWSRIYKIIAGKESGQDKSRRNEQ
jgi:hypothetical protein